MSSDSKRNAKKVLRAAQAAGWRVVNRGKHWRLYPLDKRYPPMTMSASASKATDRMLRDARDRGLNV